LNWGQQQKLVQLVRGTGITTEEESEHQKRCYLARLAGEEKLERETNQNRFFSLKSKQDSHPKIQRSPPSLSHLIIGNEN
jgi:hypothetical protein